MKKILLIAFALVILVTVFSLPLLAQGPPGPPCQNPGDPDCDPGAPFDGGVLTLIAGALGLGIKKIVSAINKT